MGSKLRLLDVFEGKSTLKVVLGISVFVVLVLELLIYIAAAGSSGQKSYVSVVSKLNGQMVYETPGSVLSSYERLNFEKNHGPLENYDLQMRTVNNPFPFREWVSAAVGLPIGLVLLMSFLIKAYLSLLSGDDERRREENAGNPERGKHKLASAFQSFHSFSIFHIGTIVILAVLMLWMVPNFLDDFAQVSISAIREYKWFFLGASIFVGSLVIWIIYLRYKLSKQMLENQFHLEKFRVETQLLIHKESAPLLTETVNSAQEQ